MSAVVLAIDIGNSKTSAGLVAGGGVAEWFRADGGVGDGAPHDVAHRLTEVYDWCVEQIAHPRLEAGLAGSVQGSDGAPADAGGGGEVDASAIPGIAVASVVPEKTRIWRELWTTGPRTKGLGCRIVDHTLPMPFATQLEHPETVGSDRWCNVAGAVAKGLGSALIVDLGTANTYDILLDGCFVGGLIAPGLVTSHDALVRAGAQLPELEFEPPDEIVGRQTLDAIRAGSWHQGVGGVASVIEGLLRVHSGLPIVLTGGVGELLAPHLGLGTEYDPHLTLVGAASLY